MTANRAKIYNYECRAIAALIEARLFGRGGTVGLLEIADRRGRPTKLGRDLEGLELANDRAEIGRVRLRKN